MIVSFVGATATTPMSAYMSWSVDSPTMTSRGSFGILTYSPEEGIPRLCRRTGMILRSRVAQMDEEWRALTSYTFPGTMAVTDCEKKKCGLASSAGNALYMMWRVACELSSACQSYTLPSPRYTATWWYSTTVGVPSDTPERAEPEPEPEPEPDERTVGGGVVGAWSVVLSMVVVRVVLCRWTYVDVRF